MFSPAKVNLLLAVTGRRPDGFHELISLVSPVSFGDELEISLVDAEGGLDFSCADPSVPAGDENLVVKAARAFLEVTGSRQGLSIRLDKRIPLEAGLGGGSGNAATTLLLLNALFAEPLSPKDLGRLAAELGSDCPLFLERAPVVMRGRGEVIERLPAPLIAQLTRRELAIFKPSIGISTPWAYQQLARDKAYANAASVEAKVNRWKAGARSLESLMENSFEAPIFRKFPAFPLLFADIRSALGLSCLVSGSGSGCLVLLEDPGQVDPLRALVESAFGSAGFFEVCRIYSDAF